VDDTGGEQNTRLERLESDISETKNRLANLETELATLKQGAAQMQSQLSGQDEKLDQILIWVTGAEKVAGIAAKHWKTALKFGCGVVTAWGISNPHVAHAVAFVGNFFGI
jgi:predicted nuclease with TOPRIM domain